MEEKRAVSPVIATVLLIMIVIVLALIILLWSRGFVKEAMTKNIAGEEKSIEKACSEVSLQSIVQQSDRCFGFQNTGNVPLYKFKLKLSEVDSGETITEEGDGVNPGLSVIVKDSNGDCFNYDNYENIKIIPVLLGKKKSGNPEPFECPESNGITI